MYCANLQEQTIRLCLALVTFSYCTNTCFVIVVPLCLSIYLKSLSLLFLLFDFLIANRIS